MAATDYDFSLTRNQIIETAFSKVGVIAPGDPLPGEQLVQGARALDLVVKELQNEHIFLWTEVFSTLTLSASTAYVEMPTDPPIIGIREGFIRVSATDDDTPIEQYSWTKYNEIADKDSTGDPVCFAVDWANGRVYVWPVQTATRYLNIIGITRAQDWSDGSSSGEFPARWQKALVYLLAADLSDDYKLPLAERQSLAQTAAICVKRAKQGDREQSDSEVSKGNFNV